MSKKRKILTVAIVGGLILVIYKYLSGQWDLTWMIRKTHSPHDLIQHADGAYYPRGESPQTIAERAMKNSLPLVGRIYAPGSTLKLDKEWQGVANYDPTKKIIYEFITPDTYTQFRADQRDQTIVDIPPSNWTTRTNIILPQGKIGEVRIRPDQVGGSGTLGTGLADKR